MDCGGKTTQRELLVGSLRALGLAPITIWTRAGYTPCIEAAKRSLRTLRGGSRAGKGAAGRQGTYPRRAENLGGPAMRRLWLTAALTELLWIYGVRIPALRALGHVVVCDRYLLDCLVDLRVNFPEDQVERWPVFRLLRRLSCPPDAAFCMYVGPEVSLGRASAKNRRHRESAETLGERCRQYVRLAPEYRVRIIDGECEPARLAVRLRRTVMPLVLGPESPPPS